MLFEFVLENKSFLVFYIITNTFANNPLSDTFDIFISYILQS
jgi:hypothetical protein